MSHWRRGPAPLHDVRVIGQTSDDAPEAQAVVAPLTGAAIFLVVVIGAGKQSAATVRDVVSDLPALVRSVGFREAEGNLTCVAGLGAQAWDRLVGGPRPAGLHPFKEIRAGQRHAVATPGDVLFHVRAARMDLCFELASQITSRLGDAVTTVDEVHGFRYFDDRDLIGFVDGTENPTGRAAVRATLIGDEDAAFAAGSYVIVQKYLHDIKGWNALPVEEQERIVGRRKLNDIELDDSVKPTYAHNALDHDREGRRGGADPARQHAVRLGRERRVRHVLHRLCKIARHDRGDARRICSSGARRATTTACWISAGP